MQLPAPNQALKKETTTANASEKEKSDRPSRSSALKESDQRLLRQGRIEGLPMAARLGA
jgi:hypothetical protein